MHHYRLRILERLHPVGVDCQADSFFFPLLSVIRCAPFLLDELLLVSLLSLFYCFLGVGPAFLLFILSTQRFWRE